jgi:hypothetical protein
MGHRHLSGSLSLHLAFESQVRGGLMKCFLCVLILFVFPSAVGWVFADNPPAVAPQSAQEAAAGESGKTGELDNQGAKNKPPEDRRWIIKMRPDTQPPRKSVAPSDPIQWGDKEHKARCESFIARLREHLDKARYYSIQGNSCATADNAKTFLDLTDSCKRECPEEFWKREGYNRDVIRNLSILHKTGRQRCMGQKQPGNK